jgi:hypothetical protein
MPQLMSMAFQMGMAVFFRLPYQAKVMKKFDAVSKTIVLIIPGKIKAGSFTILPV